MTDTSLAADTNELVLPCSKRSYNRVPISDVSAKVLNSSEDAHRKSMSTFETDGIAVAVRCERLIARRWDTGAESIMSAKIECPTFPQAI